MPTRPGRALSGDVIEGETVPNKEKHSTGATHNVVPPHTCPKNRFNRSTLTLVLGVGLALGYVAGFWNQPAPVVRVVAGPTVTATKTVYVFPQSCRDSVAIIKRIRATTDKITSSPGKQLSQLDSAYKAILAKDYGRLNGIASSVRALEAAQSPVSADLDAAYKQLDATLVLCSRDLEQGSD